MIGGSRGTSGLVVVVFALLVATTAPAAIAATGENPTPPDNSAQGLSDSASIAAQQEPPGENNSSVAHRNPSEVSDGESLGDVEVWLSREMADRLSESADLSDSDRERARELLGNDSEYAELAAQYSEVANRSGSNGTTDFAVAGQLQRQFFVDVEQYHQIHAAYRDARASNESNRTLRLAHELERRAAVVNRTAQLLNRSYANISGEGQDLENATRTIGELRGNVTRTQQTVRDQSLVRTELTVEATEPSGSFADPVPLAGRLRTADGDPVADENVTLRIGNRTVETTTDAQGRFEIRYRPTLAPAGERVRAVAFQPGNESVYLWANATAEFGVEQVTPDVTISNHSAVVRYNGSLTVNGTVAAGEVGVPDVPVLVTVDEVRIAAARTDANGSFAVAGRLPGNVSNGTQAVQVRVATDEATPAAFGTGGFGPGGFGPDQFDSGPRSDRDGPSGASDGVDRPLAIAPANGSAEITIESTSTSLSLAEVRTFNRTAFVAGRLTTEDGQPLGNRTVELRVGDRSVGNATTNATGGFATTVGLPSRLLGGDSTVRVVAAYSPRGGNLAPATAGRTATLGSTGSVISDRQLRFGAAALLALLGLAAFVLRRRSSDGSPDPDFGGGGGSVADDRHASELADATGGSGRSAEALLDSASRALDGGRTDAAAVAAYAAVRHRFGEAVGTSARTHWEFYVACQDGGLSGEPLGQLERLTRTYERAAFADEPVSPVDAREAVEQARMLQKSVQGGDLVEGERVEHGRTGRESGDRDGSPAD